MATIRRRVAEKRAAGVYGPAQWPTSGPREADSMAHAGALAEHLESMEASARCDVNGEAITSHRKLTGPFVVRAKKLTRFLVRRYTDGLFLRQAYFNHETTEALRIMSQRLEAVENELKQLKEKQS